MTKFDYSATAELFPGKNSRRCTRERYRRFSTAAEAVRYTIETLPAELVGGSLLEVEEQRFNGGQTRDLYNASAFPLKRLAHV
ncbi:MAG: hypothetical protein RLW68_14000 [Devosia marina]|uniref:hypothetical protein n=1 Tax=Devosia marina TaxID=2683198 RepID=UPI000D5EA191